MWGPTYTVIIALSVNLKGSISIHALLDLYFIEVHLKEFFICQLSMNGNYQNIADKKHQGK